MSQKKEDIIANIWVIAIIVFALYAILFDPTIIGLFCLFVFAWIGHNYEKIQYRRGALEKEMRIPVSIGSTSKWTNHIIGGVLLLVSILYLIWNNKFDQFVVCGVIGGILVVLNGILDLPKGVLRVNGNDLEISDKVSRVEQSVDWRYLEEIEIQPDRLIFTKHFEDKFRRTELDLNNDWATKIEAFLRKNIDKENLVITNNT